MGQEKRASTRYNVAVQMDVTHDGAMASGLTVNLSLGGALVRVPAEPPLRVGDRVEVSFRLPDLDKPLAAKAEVRWVDDGDGEIAGLQFVTGFRAKETWALGRFLERQSPL
ncbi:MAG: PilZ domain-containing protein [Deltaproteobacteria bacterium]|nr:PilZ domain-containing protein [Deltaproteobacteria bacterium]